MQASAVRLVSREKRPVCPQAAAVGRCLDVRGRCAIPSEKPFRPRFHPLEESEGALLAVTAAPHRGDGEEASARAVEHPPHGILVHAPIQRGGEEESIGIYPIERARVRRCDGTDKLKL